MLTTVAGASALEGGRGGAVNAAPEGAAADVVHKGLLLRHCLGVRCPAVRPRSHLVQPSHLRSLEEPLLLFWLLLVSKLLPQI